MKSVRNQEERQLLGELFSGKYRFVAGALFFITLKAAPVWLVPIATARIIDLGHSDHPDLGKLLIYVAIAIFLFLQNVPAAVLYTNNLVHLTRGIGLDLRIRICRQLQVLSLHYHSRSSVGSLHTKAIRDIEMVEQLPKLAFEQGYGFFLGLLVSSIAIAIRKPEALWFFALTVPVCAIVSSLFRRRMSDSVNDYRKSMEGMSTHLNEMVTMMPITRAHGLEEHQLRHVESGIHGVYQKGVHFDKLTQLFAAISWVVMGVMQILFLGGSMVACFKKQITVGDVVMFNTFFLTLSNSLASLLTFVPQLLQTRESLDSIIEIFSAPDLEENSGKATYETINGAFRFNNVSFSYPDAPAPAIRHLSLEIPAGTSLAVAGPSGGGKSTLLSLLIGFIRPNDGEIELDGQDMKNMDLRSYRKNVGVVTQDPVFFSGSVFENIAYGNPDVTAADVFQALEMAHARNFVEALPEGLETRLGVNGVKLSGGQMQRLAIARAIVRNPQVLILDEATSALDSESEAHVQHAIDQAMKGRTTFIVAHRLSTLKNADRIAILESGTLVECDAPAELLKRDNFYSRSINRSLQHT
ncbi:ABC transporter ATP-binding protein [Pontiellaceae bacterium B12219]|nr:ABC transporter ATP-binding protein [Pontiellaceae bacterium B12219]